MGSPSVARKSRHQWPFFFTKHQSFQRSHHSVPALQCHDNLAKGLQLARGAFPSHFQPDHSGTQPLVCFDLSYIQLSESFAKPIVCSVPSQRGWVGICHPECCEFHHAIGRRLDQAKDHGPLPHFLRKSVLVDSSALLCHCETSSPLELSQHTFELFGTHVNPIPAWQGLQYNGKYCALSGILWPIWALHKVQRLDKQQVLLRPVSGHRAATNLPSTHSWSWRLVVQCSVNWSPWPSRREISKCLSSCKDCDFALPDNPLRQISICFASPLLVKRRLEVSELFPGNDDSSPHRSAQSKRGNSPRSSQENAQCKVAPQGLQHTADFLDSGTNERTVRSHTSPTSEAAQFCAAWFPWQWKVWDDHSCHTIAYYCHFKVVCGVKLHTLCLMICSGIHPGAKEIWVLGVDCFRLSERLKA